MRRSYHATLVRARRAVRRPRPLTIAGHPVPPNAVACRVVADSTTSDPSGDEFGFALRPSRPRASIELVMTKGSTRQSLVDVLLALAMQRPALLVVEGRA